MPTITQFLYLVAFVLAPPGTHEINVSCASETYHWSIDSDSPDIAYSSTYLPPYDHISEKTDPEHPIITNNVVPANYTSETALTAQISSHNWSADHVLRFDDMHQLEKSPGGYVYAVRIGSNSQKIYSITYEQ